MDHLKRSLMTKNLNRFDILNHFGVGAALAPIHGGFLACGGVKNQLGKVCVNFASIFASILRQFCVNLYLVKILNIVILG